MPPEAAGNREIPCRFFCAVVCAQRERLPRPRGFCRIREEAAGRVLRVSLPGSDSARSLFGLFGRMRLRRHGVCFSSLRLPPSAAAEVSSFISLG